MLHLDMTYNCEQEIKRDMEEIKYMLNLHGLGPYEISLIMKSIEDMFKKYINCINLKTNTPQYTYMTTLYISSNTYLI